MGMGKNLPKDIPLLFENSTKIGLGLYNSIIAAAITEIGLLVAGLIIYLKKTESTDRTGKWAIILLILFIVLFPLTMLIPLHLSYLITFISTYLS